MDKNPKHPLKKKKVVQKVNATANHMEGEQEVSSKHKKHTYQLSENPTGCEMTTCGIFFIKFRLVQSLALMAIVVFNASGVKEVLLQLFK